VYYVANLYWLELKSGDFLSDKEEEEEEARNR
jgi:hypothetical protein